MNDIIRQAILLQIESELSDLNLLQLLAGVQSAKDNSEIDQLVTKAAADKRRSSKRVLQLLLGER